MTREHNFSETGSISSSGEENEAPTMSSPVERANQDQILTVLQHI
jgi:hypothetical protein